MKPPRQAALFDDPNLPTDTSALVGISRPKAQLSPAQRIFNRLTKQIRRQREALSLWQDYGSRFLQRVGAEFIPALHEVRAAQRRLVEQIDVLLADPTQGKRLSRRRRDKLRGTLIELLDDLLSEGPDPELEVLHDRHSPMSRADKQRMDMDLTEAFIGGVFGDDVLHGHEAKDMDELLRHAGERIADRAEAEEREREARRASRQAKRAGPSRAEQNAERKAHAEQEIKLSVREIYRKLASSLHPDREADPDERERKTALMQRVNQAFANGDLLTLLSLQIEAEQIDADHLADLPDQRLKHYNQVLRDQLRALEDEVHGEVVNCIQVLTADPWLRVSHPREVDVLLDGRVTEARNMVAEIEMAVAALTDPARRSGWIDTLPDAAPDIGVVDPVELALMQIFSDEPTAAHETTPRRPRKPRKRRT